MTVTKENNEKKMYSIKSNGEVVRIINFKFEAKTQGQLENCIAEEGMTWEEWVLSDYNEVCENEYYYRSGNISCLVHVDNDPDDFRNIKYPAELVNDNHWGNGEKTVYYDDLIIENENYAIFWHQWSTPSMDSPQVIYRNAQ